MERAAWRRWVRLRLFGHWWNAPEIVIVVIREARMLSQQDKQGLQALFALKRRSQALLLLTHTGGLSHLVNCYLDVCNPIGEVAADFDIDQMLVIHDHHGAKIRLTKNTARQGDQTTDAAINRNSLKIIAELLGWPAESERIRWQQRFDSLTHRIWVDKDILPTLVIGSTPLTQMTLAKQNVLELEQYKAEFTGELKPYQQVFQDEPALILNQESVLDTFASADQAKAILSTIIKYQGENYVFIFGRSGERKKLATALMQCFSSQQQAVLYLEKLMACGEIFNLKQLSHSLADKPWPGHRLPDSAELPIHAEAALFLLEERLALQHA